MDNKATSPWFALHVKTRMERMAAQVLEGKGIVGFAAMHKQARRWSDRVKYVDGPLFPGYIFCQFDRIQRVDVLQTPGVISIVGFGNRPAPIPDGEITSLQAAVASGLPVWPLPHLQPGTRVQITNGCLGQLNGVLLREKSSMRVIVNVTLLQRAVAVELSRDMISANFLN
jgi:transcription antitermination factor NusG